MISPPERKLTDAIPPLHLQENGDLVDFVIERDGFTTYSRRLRGEVAEWCDNHIGKVIVSPIQIEDGGGIEIRGSLRKFVFEIYTLRFETDADMVAYKLRWR